MKPRFAQGLIRIKQGHVVGETSEMTDELKPRGGSFFYTPARDSSSVLSTEVNETW